MLIFWSRQQPCSMSSLLWLLPNLGFSRLPGTVLTGSLCLTQLFLLVTASSISDSDKREALNLLNKKLKVKETEQTG